MFFDGGGVTLLFCKGRVSRVVGKRVVWRYGGVGVKVDSNGGKKRDLPFNMEFQKKFPLSFR